MYAYNQKMLHSTACTTQHSSVQWCAAITISCIEVKTFVWQALHGTASISFHTPRLIFVQCWRSTELPVVTTGNAYTMTETAETHGKKLGVIIPDLQQRLQLECIRPFGSIMQWTAAHMASLSCNNTITTRGGWTGLQ